MPPPVRLVYHDPVSDDPGSEILTDIASLRRFLLHHGYEASDHDIYLAYSAWSEDEYAAGWSSPGNLDDRTDYVRQRLLNGLLARLKPVEGVTR